MLPKRNSIILRNRFVVWLPIVAMVASLPIVYFGSEALESNTHDVTQWLPDDQGERRQYDQFIKQFGGDDFVFVTWPGCSLGDERLTRLAESLTSPVNPNAQGPPSIHDAAFIRRVITGSEMLSSLTSEPLKLSRRQAVRRMQGVFVGPDGSTTGALVWLTDEGQQHKREVINRIYQVAQDECGVDRDTLHLGGSVYEAVVIDQESVRSLRAYVMPICLVTLVLTWLCFRSLRLVVIVLAVGEFCRLLSLAIVYFTGGHINAVLIVLPVLVYVLTVSGAVHFVNYYRGAVRQHGPHGAAWRALRAGWLPCVLSAGSTAIGLGSLYVSQIGPVRSFGVYGAAGLMASVAVLLTVVPVALHVWSARTTRQTEPATISKRPKKSAGVVIAKRVVRHCRALAVAIPVVVGLLSIGLTRITTTVKLERLFRPESTILTHYRWIEEHIGPLVSVEVLVDFDKDCQLNSLSRLALIAEIQYEIEQLEDVGGTMSAATLTPRIPDSGGTRGKIQRIVFAKKLDKERQRLVDEGFLAENTDSQTWRITARVPAMHELDYGDFVQRLRDRVDGVVQRHPTIGDADVSVTYTGIAPMIHVAQEQLLADLINSFGMAVLLICPTLMIILRSPLAGLLSMIPSVAPIVAVFGALGWLGIPVDIGSVLTASVALGIAVDNTLHVLAWYTRGIRAGQNRVRAIFKAYQHCGTAMIQTTVICGLGLLVLVHSSYVPASQFALLAFVILFAALAADLVILPLILVSPLGRVFVPNHRQVAETKPQEQACNNPLSEPTLPSYFSPGAA